MSGKNIDELAEIDAAVADAEARVIEQADRVAETADRGEDTAPAKALLASYQTSLHLLRVV